MKRYAVNEIFASVQGEGVQSGLYYVFVRFAGCNLVCARDGEAGFDCDTDFTGGRKLTAEELEQEARAAGGAAASWVCFTGGEPALQLDVALCQFFRGRGWYLACETNGTEPLPDLLDWVCCSPKTAAHTLRVARANEVKVVLGDRQEPPKIVALPVTEHYLLSPRFLPDGALDRAALAWCLDYIRRDPRWRLSLQTHKFLSVR